MDSYQEQPYLLDPYLERIVIPVIRGMRRVLELLQRPMEVKRPDGKTFDDIFSNPISAGIKLDQIAQFLYWLTKIRGHKTIGKYLTRTLMQSIRFFPHDVQDLPIVLSIFNIPDSLTSPKAAINNKFVDTRSWELRYILLLWLSLICMIPFDLSQFDQLLPNQEISTSEQIEKIGWTYQGFPGKERDSAALVLARLMMRQDMATSRLSLFLDDCLKLLELGEECGNFKSTGILQVFCIIAKLSRPAQLIEALPLLYRGLTLVENSPFVKINISFRKLRTKLSGRIALISLLQKKEISPMIEVIIQELLQGLQDKDTVVRWSAAKYFGRIGEKLSEDLSIQICDTILSLFSIENSNESENVLNLLALSEYTWHGACLACAELVREKIFPLSRIDILIKRVVQALHFEQRKGIQNIGSGVRDAAAYVLWSLGRKYSVDELQPYKLELAIQLVLQSLFDREVHIRRAGSAAFQENVGRLGIFPHGIEVLQSADFFTVGLRRSAFLKAAPEISKFQVYREPIVEHLIRVSVPHWDIDIRELSAESLSLIVKLDFDNLYPKIVDNMAAGVESKDSNKVHGSLLTLVELAKHLRTLPESSTVQSLINSIFCIILRVPESTLKPYKSDPILIAICYGLEVSISADIDSCSKFLESSYWKQIVSFGLKRPNDNLHQAMEKLIAKVTRCGLGLQDRQMFSKTLRTGQIVAKQASARCLGGFVFQRDPLRKNFEQNFRLLTDCAKGQVGPPFFLIWGKSLRTVRCFKASSDSSIMLLIAFKFVACSQEQFSKVLSILIDGLSYYTNGQRGDVGSWVRVASMSGLVELIEFSIKVPSRASKFLSQDLLKNVISGLLKQVLDFIDTPRETAWRKISKVVHLAHCSLGPNIKIDGTDSLVQIFDHQETSNQLRELVYTFPKLLELHKLLSNHIESDGKIKSGLEVYFDSLVEGIVLLIGSKGNVDTAKATEMFCDYIENLDKQNSEAVRVTVANIIELARTRTRAPKLVTSCLETLAVLFDRNALNSLDDEKSGKELLKRIFLIATNGLERSKLNMIRVMAGIKMY
ncbi:armadillo-type protein [Phakopsora pachyrhizi]|uniref:Armadillo-type protein n=1 Tax=Phakopsora pachyrhizi TaxID=170000 RepID=A0AAV0B9I4_PHAPC|nr:armadillo-type protein [Phakopsora pachyrhizi]CAH7682181.1 armadillo-type protein [Phakopsora pachyrhizi]